MYSDPKHIKKHPYKVSLNEQQEVLIRAGAKFSGMSPGEYLKSLAMEQLNKLEAQS